VAAHIGRRADAASRLQTRVRQTLVRWTARAAFL